MTLRRPLLSLAAALLLCGAAPALAIPHSITASHEVHLNGIRVAVVNEHFEREKGQYVIVSTTRAAGVLALVERRSAVLMSKGRVTEDGLEPRVFEGSRGLKDKRRVQAEFDWRDTTLTLHHDGKTNRVGLPEGTQDRLSIMYQLMFFDYDARRHLDFPMTNGRKLGHYRYRIEDNAEIDTPLGRVKALHLVKEREPGDSQAEVWLAHEYGYFPVKTLIVDKGVRYEQILTRLDVVP